MNIHENHAHIYEGRLINLRLALYADLPTLYEWRTEPAELHFLSADPGTEVYADFIRVVSDLLAMGHVTIVERANTCEPIGYALTYNFDAWNGTAFAALYLTRGSRMTGHVVERATIAGENLCNRFPVRKVLFEVYESAEILLRHLRSAGYEVEGFTPNHFRHGDRYEGVWTLSMTQAGRAAQAERRERFFRWASRRAPSGLTLASRPESEPLTRVEETCDEG